MAYGIQFRLHKSFLNKEFFSNKIKGFIVVFFCILSFSVICVSAKPNLIGEIGVPENIPLFIDNKIQRYNLRQVDTGIFSSQDCLLIDVDALNWNSSDDFYIEIGKKFKFDDIWFESESQSGLITCIVLLVLLKKIYC
jgi:hypothetical protein